MLAEGAAGRPLGVQEGAVLARQRGGGVRRISGKSGPRDGQDGAVADRPAVGRRVVDVEGATADSQARVNIRVVDGAAAAGAVRREGAAILSARSGEACAHGATATY